MSVEFENFSALVEQAMADGTRNAMRPVIEKELLHYDILYALDQAGKLKNLVFQGGTSLRLCYGSNRFSEDLDFVGGKDFNAQSLQEIKEVIEKYIGERYGLEVTVKEPATLREDPKYAELKVDKWQIAITTSPEQKHLPKQRIKLEVANVPALTGEVRPLEKNYDFLPDGYADTMIEVETLSEVLADKMISLPATTKYIRYRDVWDLLWLKQQRAKVDDNLIFAKTMDYNIVDTYDTLLEQRRKSLKDIVYSKEFDNEMARFLDSEAYDRTFGKAGFKDYMYKSLMDLFDEVRAALDDDFEEDNEFIL